MSSVKVVITGAAGQIGYAFVPYICQGYIFGPDTRVTLHLLDVEFAMKQLNAVVMEIEDSAFPLVDKVVATSDLNVAFAGVDYAVFLGAFPRKEGMERKDLLERNINIFREQGVVLGQLASPNCKSVVVGNPANTNCLTLMKYAPTLPAENFSALTRLDHNRAKAALASKVGAGVADVHNSFIWGNHSSTQYPDLHHCTVAGTPALERVDEAWFKETFIPHVQKRGAAVIAARGASSAASAAKATADHLKDWVLGTKEPVSMAVISTGNSYNVPDGLIYSFPVTCEGGKWKIVDGFSINEFSRQKLDATAKELQEEKAMADDLTASL